MPVTYPFVPVPQINPLGSLSDLMSLASQFQGLSDRSRARRAAEEAAQREGQILEVARLTQGDPAAYAREVGVIDPERGRQAQADVEQRAMAAEDRATAAATRQQREFADMVQRIDRAEGVWGKGAQLLREATAQTWPDLRPKVVELAITADPERGAEMARMIPETYEPAQVRELVMSVTQVHDKLARFKKANQEFIGDGNPVEGLSQWLQLTETDAERDQVLEKARYFGMPDEQITLAQRHAKKTLEQAEAVTERGGTEFERYARDRQRELGRRWTRAETLRERAAFLATGRDPREADGEDRVLARQAETWLAHELRDLDAKRTPTVDEAGYQTRAPISAPDFAREQNAIYDGYRRMTGREHPSRPARQDPPWVPPRSPAGRPRIATSPMGPSSATAAPSARPAVMAPSIPTTQSAIPTASDFRMLDNTDGSVTVTAPDGSTVTFRNRREAQGQIDQYLQQLVQP